MDSKRWNELRRIFEEARALEGDARRERVERRCGGDSELRAEIESMLHHEQRSRRFLDGPPPMPARIGEFAILRELGRGGMGTVYLARQENPAREVALKVVHPLALTPKSIRRFEHEAAVLARLLHPGIAQIYASGTAEIGGTHVPWFAMERVEGESLIEFARARSLGVRERVALLVTVCDAVQHAHQRGVIHRDLKPANILVDASGRPKVLDFGIARTTDADLGLTTVESGVGAVIGTLPYMSPEQIGGDPGEIDTRSDVYALGVVAYELTTGTLPYPIERASLVEAARLIREVEPTPPSKGARALRGDLETILLKALEKSRERRYATAAELARDLERWLRDEPISARPPSSFYQLAKFARRNRGMVAGLAAAALALLVGTIVSTVFGVRAVRAAGEANRHLGEVREEARKKDAVNQLLADIIDSARIEALGRDATMRGALDAAERNVDGAFENAPELEAPVRHMLARAWLSLGEFARARAQIDRAAELYAAVPSTSPVDRARFDHDLGSILYAEGQLTEAAELLEDVLARERSLLGRDHADTRVTLGNLAAALTDLGRGAEVEPYLSELREIAVRVDGEDSAAALRADQLRMGVLENRGDFASLEPLARATYERAQRSLDPDAPLLSAIRNTLVVALTGANRLAEAEPVAIESLEAFARVFGPEHRETLVAMDSLACLRHRLGRLDEAEQMLRDALERSVRVCRDEDPLTGSIRGHLGVLLFERGRASEAEPLIRDALARHRAAFGTAHAETLVWTLDLALVLLGLGRLDEAESMARDGLAAAEAAPGLDGELTLRGAAILGVVLVKQREPIEALPLLERAADGYREMRGPADTWALDSLRWAGVAASEAEDWERARILCEDLHARQVESFGADDPRTRSTAERLAAIRAELDEAAPPAADRR